jgi:ABC-type spermidine/putrescine transport system permease subunit II
MRENTRWSRALVWLSVSCVLLFIYLPLLPPLVFSVATGEAAAPAFTLSRYAQMWRNPVLTNAIVTSLEVGGIVALIAPLLGLTAAMAIRELPTPRLILSLMLLPLFIPGVSAGLATALFFQLVGIPPSLVAIAIVQAVWALPFATIVILVAMTTFDPVYLEAAWMSGANRLRGFVDVELPLIRPGILGAATFSLILSFNETVRTSAVQGGHNTVQTYIWATYKQVGLSPTLYALMGLLIVLTLILVAGFLVVGARGRPARVNLRAAPPRPDRSPR